MKGKDGKIKFYRELDFDKNFFKMLMRYRRLKQKMVKDLNASYVNGKVNK